MSKMSLEKRYATDPGHLEYYTEKLIEPEWAGELSPDEFIYIKS